MIGSGGSAGTARQETATPANPRGGIAMNSYEGLVGIRIGYCVLPAPSTTHRESTDAPLRVLGN
jgi:hypothetical protein